MKKVPFSLYLMASSLQIMAQGHFPDATLDIDFNAQVKSVDEFIERFNGNESKPGLQSDSLRLLNIVHLFDTKMSHQNMDERAFKAQVMDFAHKAIDMDSPLSITNPGTIAEAKCLMRRGGKNCFVTLLLQREPTPKGGQRWAITGVKGLRELDLYGDKRITISPVDHEIHFMSLQDFFASNTNLLPGLRSSHKEIDELSLFLGLCIAKEMTFVQVEQLKFHFNAMADYSFVIEEISREGTNSGWLITRLFKTNSQIEKNKHINDIFHNIK